jgi:RNA recognition motif-containing protein
VTYETPREAEKAVSMFDGDEWEGRRIEVRIDQGRPPRREERDRGSYRGDRGGDRDAGRYPPQGYYPPPMGYPGYYGFDPYYQQSYGAPPQGHPGYPPAAYGREYGYSRGRSESRSRSPVKQ